MLSSNGLPHDREVSAGCYKQSGLESSAWINQLQGLRPSADGFRAETRVKTDEPSLVMHGESKQVGIRSAIKPVHHGVD